MAKATLVTGLFKNRVAAEAAVDAILKRGYTRDEISVLMSDATRSKEFALQAKTHAADGAGIGGAVGGAVGGVGCSAEDDRHRHPAISRDANARWVIPLQ